jgi:DNA-binding protein YbaB
MAAVNEAQKKIQASLSEQMSKVTGGLSIPGLF